MIVEVVDLWDALELEPQPILVAEVGLPLQPLIFLIGGPFNTFQRSASSLASGQKAFSFNRISGFDRPQ
jgi:hypothetical protein